MSAVSLLSTLLSPRPAASAALAWRPFLEPLPVDDVWMVLLLPLVIAVAVVYKAIKVPDLKDLPRQATLLTAQILIFMVLAAIGLWVLVEIV